MVEGAKSIQGGRNRRRQDFVMAKKNESLAFQRKDSKHSTKMGESKCGDIC